MAANDYYTANSYRHDIPSNPYHDHETRSDAPISPLPSAHSPAPYEDSTYPYSHQKPSQSHTGSGSQLQDDYDPYDDENSIPMNGRKAKHESTATVSPMLPHEMDDPFVRDIDPSKTRRRKDQDGWFRGKITWVVYVLTVAQLIVFIAELIKNGVLTKTPIEIHPSFNPMIGPSPYVLINMGARYQPCMHNMPNVQNSSLTISWPCPNATSTTGASVSCSLSELCGFNGVPNPHPHGSIHDKPAPNQWWRFIVPIFIHAGIVHISFNLLLQLTLGRDIERLIGSIRFAVVYFAAGIFGFVLGGNFAANGIASCGCSGSLFGILAITLLDLLYTWHQRKKPWVDLSFILVDVIIAFVLGLLPGLDNFSHIGGFLMGLVLGVCLLRSPSSIARRTDTDSHRYSEFFSTNSIRDRGTPSRDEGIKGFVRQPLGFFQNRRPIWWVWWLVRVAALVAVLIGFILLIKNFYVWGTTCSWCKYLSCLDVTVSGENWCAVGNLNFTPATTQKQTRDLFGLAYGAFNPMEHL